MRLIIEYTATDGYTFWNTITVPVVHESPESFIVEFDEKCKAAFASGTGSFMVSGGGEFDVDCFYERDEDIREPLYTPPRVMTVDEFFERVEK